jgi:hypothetical protein
MKELSNLKLLNKFTTAIIKLQNSGADLSVKEFQILWRSIKEMQLEILERMGRDRAL